METPSKKRKRDTDPAQASLEPVKRKHKKSSSEAAPTPDSSSTDRAERKERKEKKHKDKKRRKSESSAESSEQTTPSDSVATSSRTSVAPPAASDVKAYFENNSIAIHGTTPLTPVLAFDQLDVPAGLRSACDGFKEPTPIQACSWPAALAGQDVVGIAETGRCVCNFLLWKSWTHALQ